MEGENEHDTETMAEGSTPSEGTEVNGTNGSKATNANTTAPSGETNTSSTGSKEDTKSSGSETVGGAGNNPGEPVKIAPGDQPKTEGGPEYKQPKPARSFAFQRCIRERKQAKEADKK